MILINSTTLLTEMLVINSWNNFSVKNDVASLKNLDKSYTKKKEILAQYIPVVRPRSSASLAESTVVSCRTLPGE